MAAFACAGCTLMPASGPQSMDIRNAGAKEPESLPYALVKLNPDVVRILAKYTPRLSSAFADKSPPKAFLFGIGDTVSITIYEAAAGGLFIPAEAGVRAGTFATIPNQAVDGIGNISVPYAGAIRAKGRNPVEVQQAIVAALKDRAIEPQAVVSLAEQRTSLISVLGDVKLAGRFREGPPGGEFLMGITAP